IEIRRQQLGRLQAQSASLQAEGAEASLFIQFSHRDFRLCLNVGTMLVLVIRLSPWPMPKSSVPKITGRSRSRRPKTGGYKPILIALTPEERRQIEKATAYLDVSVSQFMAETSVRSARRLLSRHAPERKS